MKRQHPRAGRVVYDRIISQMHCFDDVMICRYMVRHDVSLDTRTYIGERGTREDISISL
jgi:hypothetical protein